MNAVDNARLDRSAFQIGSLNDDREEVEYWRARSPEERMEALELIANFAGEAVLKDIDLVDVDLPPEGRTVVTHMADFKHRVSSPKPRSTPRPAL